jgi:multimeric flavodoxin WrbA
MGEKFILGIAGSIRSNFTHVESLNDHIRLAKTRDDLTARINSLDFKFSNSDITLAFALFGAKEQGYGITILSISKIFKLTDYACGDDDKGDEHFNRIGNRDFLQLDPTALQNLLDLTQQATGIIVSSPVYFGDRSSVANKFMQLTNKHKLLKNKVFGMISVGAKRNGGQETTCIYGLYEALMQEAIGVGNGPQTSQYGGTVVAGDMHTAFADVDGLDRCVEVGQRVAAVSQIVDRGSVPDASGQRLKIKVLVTMDTQERKFQEMVTNYFSPFMESHDVDIVNLIDYDIFRCMACSSCPFGSERTAQCKEKQYTCRIQSSGDDFGRIHDQLVNNDCLVIVGVNTERDLIYRYQAFTERSRYLRRDDFQLTNTPIVGMFINEVGAINNSLHTLKVLTSYIRHNTIILKPVEIICHDDTTLYESSFENLIPTLQLIAKGRNLSPAAAVSYKAQGFSQTSRDKTSALRK